MPDYVCILTLKKNRIHRLNKSTGIFSLKKSNIDLWKMYTLITFVILASSLYSAQITNAAATKYMFFLKNQHATFDF